jgi:tRNA modification GTPase
MAETIVALATPTGRSGIGVVRMSGDRSLYILQRLVGDHAFRPGTRTAHLRSLCDPDTGEAFDDALVTFFHAPHSFTGEDVVEISCHGSPVVLRQVIDVCLSLGANLAEPGEFTLRAVANGRMDLTEAEAIRDLIDAQTVAAARQSVRQLSGEFSHELQPIKDRLLDVIVLLESSLEFVEDDLPAVQKQNVREDLEAVRDRIGKMASTYQAGHLIRDGLNVVIVGRPNVGKSSLFNALLARDRAIVTDIAGTTRDQLHERITIGDIPVSLTDTAGLRETSDTVESIGVERSRRTMFDADLVLVMLDAAEPLSADDEEILTRASEIEHIVLLNKIDKVERQQLDELTSEFRSGHGNGREVLAVSALTEAGLEELRRSIVRPFKAEDVSSGFLVSDARHFDLLNRAALEIGDAADALGRGESEEIVLIGLHNAMRYLGQITGETTTEDMLTRIFSTFCIGK